MALIFLCGLPGAGKSAVGKLLAAMRGSPFIDLDTEIERVAGKPIPAIFQSEGETHFRRLESLCLQDVLYLANCVIALGGGTLASERNFQLVKDHGTLVYLQTDTETLADRIQYETHRPLLADAKSQSEVKQKLDELLLRREREFLMAAIIVNTSSKSSGEVAEETQSLLSQ